MPRPKTNSLEDGLMTVPLLSRILHLSPPTIRKLCDNGSIANVFRIPGTRERRIPAPSVTAYLLANNIPVPLELQSYVVAYNTRYGTHQAKA